MKIPLLAVITILTTVIAIPLVAHTASANAGLGVNDPNNTWTPYGPHATINKILLKYYEDDSGEFTAFQNGGTDGLDYTDSGQSGTGPAASDWPTYDANPDWNMSAIQGGSVYHGLYFNGASSRFSGAGASWCDWVWYNSVCGQHIRQGFQHLIDRNAFTSNFGGLTPIWDDSPANKALTNGQPFQTQASSFCTWDLITNTGCSAASGPYNEALDSSGFATPGSPDFCTAADHMIAAGLATGKAAGTCVLTGVKASVLANPFRAKVRSTQPRRSLGLGFVNALNQLFGAGVTTVQIGNINTIGHAIVFSEIISPVDDWDMYTYGYQDTGPFLTAPYAAYSGQFSFNGVCPTGVSPANEPTNPNFICITALDTALNGAIQTGDEATFDNLMVLGANSALVVAGRNAIVQPEYTLAVRTPALRSVIGLTNSKGVGFETPQNALSAHKGSYTPVDSRFAFNGGGSSDTVRWGQASGTDFLNLFQAGSVWEFNNWGLVYDSVMGANPIATNQVWCNMCQSFQQLNVGGDAVFRIFLRQNLRWQDGASVDAYDVAFSFFNLRDYSSNLSGGNLPLLKSITIYDPLTLDIHMTGQSVGHLPALTLPIMPRHLWECPANGISAISGFGACNPTQYSVGVGGTVGQADPGKVDASYDPVAAGTYIGSGGFACVSQFPEDLGKIGTGCTFNSDGTRGSQSITGSSLLTRFDFTGASGQTDPFAQWFRNNNPSWGNNGAANKVAAQSGGYQEFLWADRDDTQNVTIVDLNSVANCVGHTANGGGCTDYAYWNRPVLHPSTPNVVGNELAIVSTHLDDWWVQPYTWGAGSGGIGPLANNVAFPTTNGSGCPYGTGTPPNC